MTPPNTAIKLFALLALAITGSAVAGSTASAQSAATPPVANPPAVTPVDAPVVNPIELAGAFTYLHTNAPPGGCGCISMVGGSGSAAYYYGPHFALVTDVSYVHNGNANNTGKSLNFASYLFGARVPVPLQHTRFIPFGQILLGVTHDSGPIAQASASSYNTVIAAEFGGGLDYRLTPHLTLRAVQAEYLLTRFANGVNDRQNNLRIDSGVAVRF
jgi:peptidoglycan-associated lipoprotein